MKRRKNVWSDVDQKKTDAEKRVNPFDDAAFEYCLGTLLRSCLDGAAARELNKTEPPSEEPVKYERNVFV